MIKFDLCLNCEHLRSSLQKSKIITGTKNTVLLCYCNYTQIGTVNKGAVIFKDAPTECPYYLEHFTLGKSMDSLSNYSIDKRKEKNVI